MGHLQEALNKGFPDDSSSQAKGRLFELALRQALKAHPGEWGQSRFENVWHWKDWPAREQFGYSAKDPGIDLVAKNNENWGGGYAAIQAKYGLSDISTQQVDSFLAGSANSSVFQDRILVADRRIATHGEQKIEKARPRVQILRLREIDSWVPDWREVLPERIENLEINFTQHELRDYQEAALVALENTFSNHARGKLILPCGTGKSYVALRAAERIVGVGGTILYLVPSISLMGQTMREWSRHRDISHQYIGICSDVTTGRNKDLEAESYAVGQFSELAMPVTTDAIKITDELAKPVPQNTMRVVFSTYQSSKKVMAAIRAPSLRDFEFDLAICDEAHRTTGIESASEASNKPESKPFQLIHSDTNIPSRNRLYMTATPRVFAENVRKRMDEVAFDGQSYSMDDPATYGPVAYRMSFAEAIEKGWLSDYRVVVIGVSEENYLKAAGKQPITFEDGKQVDPGTVVRLAGCWDALATPGSQVLDATRNLGELSVDQYVNARSAIAFTSRVKDSITVQNIWTQVANWHQGKEDVPGRKYLLLDVNHLDAKTPASDRNELIDGLRNASEDGVCKVLTNVGVLSEGVDVPALDAVVFLQSRSSPVDVTQAIGRVMRKAEGKEVGYVIIPVVVPAFNDVATGSIEELIDASDFKPVWDIIRALRSHDERIDHMLEARTMPVVLRIPTGGGGRSQGTQQTIENQRSLFEVIQKFNDQFGSIMLDKCGDRQMYPNWGREAGRVCRQIEVRLETLVEHFNDIRADFLAFRESLRGSVSPDITLASTMRMVAQHLVTVPVFDELFGNSMFAARNPITQSMTRIKHSLEKVGVDFDAERAPLARAYRMMNTAFETATDPSTRLDVLRAIFDGFFRQAMPDEVKSMGIAYTPIEIVDFVIKFADQLCQKEFSKGLTDRDVHILDPFTGTGTFIAHLLECTDADGNYVIRDADLNRKYVNELHANELVLLAYYIAALKIEETKHRRSMGASGATNPDGLPYEQFEHIVLTDSFHLTSSNRKTGALFGKLSHNTERANDQLRASVRVILGNPPWSTGKDDASEADERIVYEDLSGRVSTTYVSASREIRGRVSGKASGNLYVKAFRWATDRILQNNDDLPSIIAFVSPNSLSDGTSLVGMRKVLRDEFSDIYVINLRGNAYKSGDERRKEGAEVFGNASRNGVQITFLIRDPRKDLSVPAKLHYAIVPERKSLQEKFTWLKSICDPANSEFKQVPVHDSHDWIDLQNPEFDELMEVCRPQRADDKRYVVDNHCLGITTNMDTYVVSFSKDDLRTKVENLISTFNDCADKYASSQFRDAIFNEIVNSGDAAKIKWTDKLKATLKQRKTLQYDESKIREMQYRPFTKCFLYEDWEVLSGGKSAAAMFPKTEQIDSSMGRGYSDIGSKPSQPIAERSIRERDSSRPKSVQSGEDSKDVSVEHAGNQQTSRSSKHSGDSASTSFAVPAIIIAAPNAQSLAGICSTVIPIDLHCVAPGQTSRILMY